LLGNEVKAALEGRYGATTRISGGQRSVTLYTAIPIRSRGSVIGAVVVSQSTLGILQTLDAVRLEIFKVVLASVAVAIVLTLMVSTTIARPLKRLRGEARAIVDRRGRLKGGFSGSNGHDEIADLARALEQLTAQLRGHIAFIEAFASDVSHEFKNPLASIRSAAEVLGDIDDPERRRRFLAIIAEEVARMERLLSGVSEVTRIDAKLDEEEKTPVDLTRLMPDVVEAHRRRAGSRLSFELTFEENEPFVVEASPDRVAEIFENLLDNASSFSPQGGVVRVALRRDGMEIAAIVEDSGPGVPPEHAGRIFDRFFSYRPTLAGASSRNGHAGLGLAIVKAIVEGYGGCVRATNRGAGGAQFEVRLPAA
jgi:two-component system sensor histidine kinase ChvG